MKTIARHKAATHKKYSTPRTNAGRGVFADANTSTRLALAYRRRGVST